MPELEKVGCRYKSIRESPAVHCESPAVHFPKREPHSRTPDSVLLEPKLSVGSKVTYAVLSRHSFRNGQVYIGQRRVATILRVGQSSVERWIRELIDAGKVELGEPFVHGRRANYRLLSNIFQPVDRKKFTGKRKGISSVTIAAGKGADAASARDEILGA